MYNKPLSLTFGRQEMINGEFCEEKRLAFHQAVNAVANEAATVATNEATVFTRNEERVKLSIGVKRLYDELLARGVSAPILAGMDVEGILLGMATNNVPVAAATGATEGNAAVTEANAGVNTGISEPPTKKRNTNRSGTEQINGRAGFQHWTSQVKLDFIVAKADPDTAKYTDSDRQWLQRVNPIAKCYVDHCGRNCATFMQCHKSLNITKLRNKRDGMHGCEQCKAVP
jgi:hypothetical protein